MNIGEIARRAGVSRSTVSYALSGKRAVSAETRRRIQAVIDELDYRPNAAARALKEGRTRTLGLVIPPASLRLTDMQLGFVASVVEAAARADLDVLLSPVRRRPRPVLRTGRHRPAGRRRHPDGDPAGGRAGHPAAADRPAVRHHRAHRPPDGTCAGSTSTTPTLIARCVHHLADLGHRHVALINRSAELVAAGYGPGPPRPGRLHRGRPPARPDRRRPAAAPTTPRAGEACLDSSAAEHPEVTAIATINEAALPGIQRALERAGLAVPRDFSITGVVARHWAEDFRPPLTAADVPDRRWAPTPSTCSWSASPTRTRRPGTCCSPRRSRCAPAPDPRRTGSSTDPRHRDQPVARPAIRTSRRRRTGSLRP